MGELSLAEIKEKTSESVEQNQTVRMYRLKLFLFCFGV